MPDKRKPHTRRLGEAEPESLPSTHLVDGSALGSTLGPEEARSGDKTEERPPSEEVLSMLTPRQSFAGRFQVVRPLGAGGMGAVYLARDERLGRDVAVKTVRLRHLAGPRKDDWLRVFRREATAVAQLQHPQIVTLHDFGVDDGVPYLVLEYLRGRTLGAVLEDSPLSAAKALGLARQLALALVHAHDMGVLHRDLKPGNLFVLPGNRLKVMDFGVAILGNDWEALAQRMGSDAKSVASEHGETPLTAGTPLYMAPEQMLGWEQDARVDIWAFGAVFYAMLTGHPPFALEQIMSGQGEPDYGAIPSNFRSVVRDCLARRPSERLHDARKLLERLTQLELRISGKFPSDPGRRTFVRPPDLFVGRVAELRRLGDLIDGGSRLVTLLGPAGSGKTRVALEFCAEEVQEFADIVFVDLAEAASFESLLVALSRALDVPVPSQDSVSELGHVISGRGRVVVVLDNFEQVASRAGETIALWMERAPQATFLVTSRHRLGLIGEQTVYIEPLPVPEADELSRIETCDSVRLFVSRARAGSPGFVLNQSNARHVAAIVRSLDGLPLAIELAAARARMLTPKRMLDRLAQRFELLRSRRKDVSARQATLQGAITWSWELLEEWERSALAQLSVFEQGFTLEGAESVVDVSAWSEAPFVIDVLEELVDKSLVQVVGEDAAGERRFGLLVSIQAFAAGRLALAEGGVRERAIARHAEFFSRFGAEDFQARLRRHGSIELLRALQRDYGNLVKAVERSLEQGEANRAGWALRALHTVVTMQGPLPVSHRFELEVLRATDLDEALRAFILASSANTRARLGDLKAAEQCAREGLDLAQKLDGNHRLVGLAHSSLGAILHHTGKAVEARAHYIEASTHAELAGDNRTQATVEGNLGLLERAQGNLKEAERRFDRAVDIAEQAGDIRTLVGWMSNRAMHFYRAGRNQEAAAQFKDTVRLARKAGDRRSEAISVGTLGVLQEPELARVSFAEAARLMSELGDRRWHAVWTRELADIDRVTGRLAAARAGFDIAERTLRAIGRPNDIVSLLAKRGLLDLAEGRLEAAQDAFREARATLPKSAGSESPEQVEVKRLAAALDALEE